MLGGVCFVFFFLGNSGKIFFIEFSYEVWGEGVYKEGRIFLELDIFVNGYGYWF